MEDYQNQADAINMSNPNYGQPQQPQYQQPQQFNQSQQSPYTEQNSDSPKIQDVPSSSIGNSSSIIATSLSSISGPAIGVVICLIILLLVGIIAPLVYGDWALWVFTFFPSLIGLILMFVEYSN